MREDEYEEFTYPLSAFDEKPSRKKWIVVVAIVVALFMLAGIFVAVTAQGRAWASGTTAIVTQAFSQALGFGTHGGASTEISMDVTGENSNADGGADADSPTSSEADIETTSSDADGGFAAQLPPVVAKKTATKKSSAKSAAAAASSVDLQNGVSAFSVDSDVVGSTTNSVGSVMSSSVVSTTSASVTNDPTANVSLGTTYPITVMVAGNGRGFVSSTEAGIACDGTGVCSWNFLAGQKVTLHASHDAESLFGGWSGGCSGTTATCTLAPHSAVTVTATFRLTAAAMSVPIGSVSVVANQSINVSSNIPAQTPSSSVTLTSSTDIASDANVATTADTSSTNTTASTSADTSSPPTNTGGNILIAVVQIAGAESSNDFVKLFNPTGTAVDMTGWKLHKRSSTGADYSLKSFANGTTIAAGGYFTWANSADGFSDAISADVASTQTLSADNSVALLDASGNVIDAVAWGTGVGQYGEGPPFPTDPAAGQVLTRQTSGGAMVNTENNASDFSLSG